MVATKVNKKQVCRLPWETQGCEELSEAGGICKMSTQLEMLLKLSWEGKLLPCCPLWALASCKKK